MKIKLYSIKDISLTPIIIEVDEKLTDNLKKYPNLECLDVMGNGLSPSNCPPQEYLVWQEKNYTDYSLLQKSLSKNQTIERLSFDDCEIGMHAGSIYYYNLEGI